MVDYMFVVSSDMSSSCCCIAVEWCVLSYRCRRLRCCPCRRCLLLVWSWLVTFFQESCLNDKKWRGLFFIPQLSLLPPLSSLPPPSTASPRGARTTTKHAQRKAIASLVNWRGINFVFFGRPSTAVELRACPIRTFATTQSRGGGG